MKKAMKMMVGVVLSVLAMALSARVGLDAHPAFPLPEASGTNVRLRGDAVLDYSNAAQGYVMARFTRDVSDVRILITNPGGVRYQYNLNTQGRWEIFPLSGGDGRYAVQIVERVDGNRFAVVLSTAVDVVLEDAFAPFLRPNQFVNFGPDSAAVAKAAELTCGMTDVIDRVAAVYNFVVTYIEYDLELAANVRAGYVPDIDWVLARRMGICFDYAALMTAMLRSLGIPTKLVIGYAGTVLHAWIDVYSPEYGWISRIIHFDGNAWNLVDPTWSASAHRGSQRDRDRLRQLIGDGTHHTPTNLH